MKEYFNKYFIDIIRNHYFDFRGKMDGKTFASFFLNCFIVNILIFFFFLAVNFLPIILFNIKTGDSLMVISVFIMMILQFLLLVTLFFACVRRQRDIDEKKWFLYFLLLLIPFIGNIVYIVVLFVLPTQKKQETDKQIEC